MKILNLSVACALACSPLFAQQPVTPALPPATVPDVLATVDGEDITKADAVKRLQERLGERAAGLPPEQLEQMVGQMAPQLVEELVAEKLFEAEIEKKGIEVSDEEVDARFQEVLAGLPEGTTKEAFLQQIGTTEEDVRSGISSALATDKLLQPKAEGAGAATPEETKAFYDENPDYFKSEESVSARHILIKTEGITDVTELGKKRAQIDEIRKRLVGESPEDFEVVAQEVSEGPSAPQGGDLGQFGRGQMVEEFDKAVFELEPGVVSEPVKTQFGFHLIKVDSKAEAGMTPFDDVSPKITEYLAAKKKSEVIKAYVDELRKGAEIELFVPEAPAQ